MGGQLLRRHRQQADQPRRAIHQDQLTVRQLCRQAGQLWEQPRYQTTTTTILKQDARGILLRSYRSSPVEFAQDRRGNSQASATSKSNYVWCIKCAIWCYNHIQTSRQVEFGGNEDLQLSRTKSVLHEYERVPTTTEYNCPGGTLSSRDDSNVQDNSYTIRKVSVC